MQTMANHKSYFTEVSSSYRGLAAQIKQGRNRRRPWRNLMGCYQEKLERLLGGEKHTGQDADCETLQQASTGQLREARELRGARTAQVPIQECRWDARWHETRLSPASYERTPTGSPLYCTRAPTTHPARNWHLSAVDFGKSHFSSAERPMDRQVMRLNTTKSLCSWVQGIITPARIS